MFRMIKGIIGAGLLLLGALAEGDELEALKDPTQPLRGSVKQITSGDSGVLLDTFLEAFGAYTVGSILVSPNRKMAIVNGQQVQVGSEVDGAKVVSIDRDNVTLVINNETQQIFMNDGTLKQETP